MVLCPTGKVGLCKSSYIGSIPISTSNIIWVMSYGGTTISNIVTSQSRGFDSFHPCNLAK
jgi:hypothetical protein